MRIEAKILGKLYKIVTDIRQIPEIQQTSTLVGAQVAQQFYLFSLNLATSVDVATDFFFNDGGANFFSQKKNRLILELEKAFIFKIPRLLVGGKIK